MPHLREYHAVRGVQPRQHFRSEEVWQVLKQVVQLEGRHPAPALGRGGARAAAPAAAPPGLKVVPAEAGAASGDRSHGVRRGAAEEAAR